MLHGSGPGASAWANWRATIPVLAKKFRVIAPDLVGFGYTQPPSGVTYDLDLWVTHVRDLLDTLGLERVGIVGNSFGGGVALHFADRAPERVSRLVCMGSVGVRFPITAGLERVWGFTLSRAEMRQLMDSFAYDQRLVTDELAEMRFVAAARPGVQDAFASMFPPPRQRWVDSLSLSDDRLGAIRHETLIIHGREDKIIPLAASYRLHELIKSSQLHVFGKCGHWTQIECKDRFNRLVSDFFAEQYLK
jgi:2-hydroxymuconate-semialdehyde hydrolase